MAFAVFERLFMVVSILLVMATIHGGNVQKLRLHSLNRNSDSQHADSEDKLSASESPRESDVDSEVSLEAGQKILEKKSPKKASGKSAAMMDYSFGNSTRTREAEKSTASSTVASSTPAKATSSSQEWDGHI